MDHIIGLEDRIVNAKLPCQCQYSDGVDPLCCGHDKTGEAIVLF